MKKTTLIIALLLCIQTSWTIAQEVTIGQTIPFDEIESKLELELITGNNSDVKVPFESLLGKKVTLIDFWATWCGACIVEMPHLEKLQREFKDDLTILSISQEKRERQEKFVRKKGNDLTFFRDAEEELSKIFPYRSIPHSVLIDRNGKVLAITQLKNITASVIEKIIAGEAIDLPLKKDNMDFNIFEDDYFNVDPNTKSYFVLQPGNPNVPGFSQWGNGGFSHKRRYSSLNTSISNMYLAAFQIKSRQRLAYQEENPWYDNYENPKNRYCMDLIVAEKDSARFHEIFREKLDEALDIKARIEIREMKVFLLKKHDSKPFSAKKVEKKGGGSSRGDYFKMAGVPVENFSNYLETHGITSMPVVDDTGIEGLFQFDFSFLPGDKESFNEAMEKLGLKLEKGIRKIEVLVLYEEKL